MSLLALLETAPYRARGFLPARDPLTGFAPDSPYALLDRLGHDLPSLLMDAGARAYLAAQTIPAWPQRAPSAAELPQLQLYYLRLGFLASGFINQVGQPPAHTLPANLAVPLAHACRLLGRPPILSYDGYALHNWKRLRADGPIALGNIDTLQNFVHLYDEHWFILVHVEIEALAAPMFDALLQIAQALKKGAHRDQISAALSAIASALQRQADVLRRIPEHMSAELYFRTFRPYIRFFDKVTYAGVSMDAVNFRGETGAQSSIMPMLVALMKIPHRPSALTNHLADMRHYMPAAHRHLIEAVEQLPDLRPLAAPEAFDAVLEAMARFREIHYGWARDYIDRYEDDPRGTGGTPFMQWLQQLIEETLDYRVGLPQGQ